MNNLLSQFAEFFEKQDLLSKFTESERLHGYSYSEIHTIAAIGDVEEPNVTQIALYLKMTKGAVSKITKRLLKAKLIETYTHQDNKQKIFFKLTTIGYELYKEHEVRHDLWLERDSQFLNQFSEHQLNELSRFMTSYNGYLEEQIKELGGK